MTRDPLSSPVGMFVKILQKITAQTELMCHFVIVAKTNGIVRQKKRNALTLSMFVMEIYNVRMSQMKMKLSATPFGHVHKTMFSFGTTWQAGIRGRFRIWLTEEPRFGVCRLRGLFSLFPEVRANRDWP